MSDRHVNWQTEQHVKRGEARECVSVSSGHSSCPRAGAAVYLWDRGLGALSGPASAPDWLQGCIRQPQTSQLWPVAWGSSGITLCTTAFFLLLMVIAQLTHWNVRMHFALCSWTDSKCVVNSGKKVLQDFESYKTTSLIICMQAAGVGVFYSCATICSNFSTFMQHVFVFPNTLNVMLLSVVTC